MRRARAGGQQAHIVCVGDSITKGAGGTGITGAAKYLRNGYVGQLRKLVNERFGHAGTGIVHFIDTSVTTMWDDRHVWAGTWTDAAYGAFNHGCKQASGSGNTYTFTPGEDADELILYFAKRSDGGMGSVSVDAGAPVSVNHNGSNAYDTVSISVPRAADHVLTYTAPASGQGYLLGVEARDSAGLVRVTQVGRGGVYVTDLMPNATAINSLQTTVDMADPDLVSIFMGVNRETTGTYTSNTIALTEHARDEGASVVLVAPFKDGIVGASPTYEQMHAALVAARDSLSGSVEWVDLYAQWADFATMDAPPYDFFSDDRHPANPGHLDIARNIFGIVYARPVASAKTSSGGGAGFAPFVCFARGSDSNNSIPTGGSVTLGTLNVTPEHDPYGAIGSNAITVPRMASTPSSSVPRGAHTPQGSDSQGCM